MKYEGLSGIIKIGDSILISDESKELKCKIEKVNDAASVFMVFATPGSFTQGKSYRLTCLRSDGMIEGVGTVAKIAKPEESNIQGLAYIISVITPFEKKQKRKNVRHDCQLPVAFTQLGYKEKHEGLILNISGGGAKIVTNSMLPSNAAIRMRTKLNESVLDIEGVVLERIDQDAMHSIYKYAMRVMFINKSAKKEEVIVKYIFEEYRKKRVKERVSSKTNA